MQYYDSSLLVHRYAAKTFGWNLVRVSDHLQGDNDTQYITCTRNPTTVTLMFSRYAPQTVRRALPQITTERWIDNLASEVFRCTSPMVPLRGRARTIKPIRGRSILQTVNTKPVAVSIMRWQKARRRGGCWVARLWTLVHSYLENGKQSLRHWRWLPWFNKQTWALHVSM